MRRKKFVELASAWLDGELTPEEEKLLQDELRDNPESRALFAVYKRMNKAAARARFPRTASAARPARTFSTMSWALSGIAAGVILSSAFLYFRDNPAQNSFTGLEAALVEVPETLAVCSDERASVQHPRAKVETPVLLTASQATASHGARANPGAVSEILGPGLPTPASLPPESIVSRGKEPLDSEFPSLLVSYSPMLRR